MEDQAPSFHHWTRQENLYACRPGRCPAFRVMACASSSQMTPPPAPSPLWQDGRSDDSDGGSSSDETAAASGVLRRRPVARHARPMRPAAKAATGTRKMLREFLGDLLDSGKVEGLRWLDRHMKTFEMPWRHANKRGNGYDPKRDTMLTRLWALNTQKYDPDHEQPDPSKWKTNFRCALNSLRHSIVELESHEPKGYKIYRFDDSRRGRGRSLQAIATTRRPSKGEKDSEGLGFDLQGSPADLAESQSPATPASTTIKDLLAASALDHQALDRSQSVSACSLRSGAAAIARQAFAPSRPLPIPTPAPSDGWNILDDCGDSGALTWTAVDALADLSRHASSSDLSMGDDFLDDLHPTFSPSPFADSGVSCSESLSAFMCPGMADFPPCQIGIGNGILGAPEEATSSAAGGISTPALPPLAADARTGGPSQNPSDKIYISVSYRQNAVAGCKVPMSPGCRIFYGPLPLEQDLLDCDFERLYGDRSMKQMALPAPVNNQSQLPSLNALLTSLVRGVCFEVENDNIYATRLCHPHIFWGTAVASNKLPLVRGERTCIFDYSTFQAVLQEYQTNSRSSSLISGHPPVHTAQLCVAQPWGPYIGRLAINNLITITVTHCKAEHLLEQLHVQQWHAQKPLATDHILVDDMSEDDMKVQRLLGASSSLVNRNT